MVKGSKHVCFKVSDEKDGFIRAIAATSGSFLLIGTTKNTIWKGTMDTGFYRVQQVRIFGFYLFLHDLHSAIYLLVMPICKGDRSG